MAGLLLLVLLLGIAWEWLAEQGDKKTFPPMGKVFTIDGHAMHLHATGSGSPTIVFAAGWKIPTPVVDFYPLYHELARHARCVVYDRPGYGWSAVTDAPRDIDTITGEIHKLLQAAGEKPPYLLVGHSLGGLEMLRFAQMYGKEVKGIVLIDGSSPTMYSDRPEPSAVMDLKYTCINWLYYAANKTGLSRLLFGAIPGFYDATPLGSARNNLTDTPPDFKKCDTAMFLANFNNTNQRDEAANKKMNCREILARRHLGDVPLVVITSGALDGNPALSKSQDELARWSRNSEHIRIPDAGHAIHWSHPARVNTAILRLLGQPS